MMTTERSPTVSVVIPVFNRERMIVRAVESVLGQSYGDFEVLVCDDCSTDDTVRVVEAIADPRVRCLVRGINGGNAAARNLGVANARGEYVAFLDSDDEYHPDFLERVVATLADSPESVGFAWTGIIRVEEREDGAPRRTPKSWNPKPLEDRYLQFLRTLRVGTDYGLTVKRACFDMVGLFDERFRVAVDRDFLLRIVQSYSFVPIPEPLVIVHDHGQTRVRRDTTRKAAAYELLITKHGEALSEHPDVSAAYHYKAGWLHYHAGNRDRARFHLRKVLEKRPYHVKAWSALMLFELFGQRGGWIHRAISNLVPSRE